jgi:competence protein ComEA
MKKDFHMKLSSLRALFLALICTFSTHSFAEAININTASQEQISQTLTGIGPSKAAAIVAYRTENGPFQSIDQIEEVKGIGAATVDKNRDLILVSEPKPSKK